MYHSLSFTLTLCITFEDSLYIITLLNYITHFGIIPNALNLSLVRNKNKKTRKFNLKGINNFEAQQNKTNKHPNKIIPYA